jgi:ankyrin repeat protein
MKVRCLFPAAYIAAMILSNHSSGQEVPDTMGTVCGGKAALAAEPDLDQAALNQQLFTAINRPDAAAVVDSLERGADPNAVRGRATPTNLEGNWSSSALMDAVGHSDVEIVRLLLAAGADPRKNQPSHGTSPVDIAVKSSNPRSAEVIELLLKAGASLTEPPPPSEVELDDWWQRRRAGVIEGNIRSRLHDVANPADRDLANYDPQAVVRKVNIVLNAGVGLEERNEDGQTALIVLAREGDMQGRESQLPIIKDLLARGADLHAQDRNGYTALHGAVINLDPEVADMLSKAGARADIKDNAGLTPADCARDVYPRADLLKVFDLPAPPMPAGGIRAHVHPSRTEGVAPLAVFFDGVGTDGLDNDNFVRARYDWDFDTTGVDPGHPRRTAIGFNVAHVFREPGEYTVRMRVKDCVGKTGETTITINVLPFTGRTFHVAADGNDEGPGTIDQPWKSFTTALERAEPNTRILLRRGDTFPTADVGLNEREGPVIVGAYTDPNRPSQAAPLIDGTGGVALSRSRDWRFMDLHFRGQSPRRGEGHGQFSLHSSRNLLFWNLEIERIGSDAFGNSHSDGVFVVDCHMHDFGAYGMFSTRGTRLALIGNRLRHMHTFEHGFRAHGAKQFYIAHNDLTDLGDVKSAVSLRTPFPERVVFVGNQFQDVVAIAGQHYGYHRHVLIAGNVSTCGFWVSRHNFVLRNNRMVWNPERPFAVGEYQEPDRHGNKGLVEKSRSIRPQPFAAFREGGVSENMLVENNSYVGPQFLTGRVHHLEAYRNIIVGPSSLGALAEKLDNNLHFSESAEALEKWLVERRAAGQCANSKIGDPKFLSLDPASPDFLRPNPGGPGAGLGAQVLEGKQ